MARRISESVGYKVSETKPKAKSADSAKLAKSFKQRLNAVPKADLKGSRKLSEILGVKPIEDFVAPKKLSKAGKWAKAHPEGLEFTYIDWRAVLK